MLGLPFLQAAAGGSRALPLRQPMDNERYEIDTKVLILRY